MGVCAFAATTATATILGYPMRSRLKKQGKGFADKLGINSRIGKNEKVRRRKRNHSFSFLQVTAVEPTIAMDSGRDNATGCVSLVCVVSM